MTHRSRLYGGLLGTVSLFALLSLPAAATPTNGTIVAGGAGGSIVPSGADITVNTGTDAKIVIDWDTFNIANGETVLFNQLNNQSIALNRVVGPLAQSTIDGILQSNGHVWIMNSAGVAFGANANVDVGALLATTADISVANFMATDPTSGTFTFTDAGGTGAIIVANGADLDTTGLLALVAPMVTNSGDLTSSHGDVLLGGAEAFRIKFASTARNNGAAFNELLVTDFIIDGGSSTAAAGGDVVHQTSTGRAIGGRVLANASRVGGGAFLNMEGLVEAQDVGTLSGDVMLLGGVDLTGGALGATATDAVKSDNMTIVAPGTGTAMGTAVTLGTNPGPASTGGGTSSTGSVSITATAGDVTANGGFTATTGTIDISATGNVDVGDLLAPGNITVTGADIDLVGTNRSVNATSGAVSLTANGGGVNNVSSSGVVDIDGDSVTISGALTGTAVDVLADAGNLTANNVTATAGNASVVASSNIDVDDVTATGRVDVGSAGQPTQEIDVGDVSGDAGVQIFGTDVDLTGTNGSVRSTAGNVGITATVGANDISASGAIDIDANGLVQVFNDVNAGGNITIDSATSTVRSLSGNVTTTSGSVAINTPGAIDLNDVSGTTTVQVTSTGSTVDIGDVSGPSGVTVSGTDIDFTGTNKDIVASAGTVSITATGGGANNISSTGALDIDGNVVTLSGNTTAAGDITIDAATGNVSTNGSIISTGGLVSIVANAGNAALQAIQAATGVTLTANQISATSIQGTLVDIDADAGTVTANGVTATGGSVAIDAAGIIDVDAVSATTSVRIVSTGGNATPQSVQAGTDVTIAGSQVGATTVQGSSVDIDATAGTVTANGVTATGGSVAVDATGAIDVDDVSATTSARIVSTGGAVDVGDISAVTGATVSGTDIDLTGANGSIQVTTGGANLTATGGGPNNISAAGAMDIDAHQVNLSGATTATSIDIDATNGPVTGNAVTATAGSVSIDSSNGVDLDDVTATTTVRVVSTLGAVDVGNVTGPDGVTISGTDIDLTGAGGSVQSANGTTSLAATGGGANNISAAGAMDIDGNSIVLSGPVVGGGAVNLTADVGDISSAGVLDVTGTSVAVSGPVNGNGGVALTATTGNVGADSAIASAAGTVALSAVNGDIDVTSVSGATGATFTAQDIDFTGSINAGVGPASLTATAGDISTPGLLDIDGGSIVLSGPVQAGTGIDLDASTGGISATGDLTTTAAPADLRATNGTISIQGLSAPGGISLVGAAVNYAGALVTQGQVFLEALTGALTGGGASSIAAPNGAATARALGGAATLNNVVIGGDLSVLGGSTTMTGASVVGGTATLQALTGNVHVAGSLNALGGILLIEAPSGAAVINSIASNSDVSLVVLDLDLTGTISAGDQFNLTAAGTGRTIIIGGSGGTDGVTLRRPQGFTLDASEVTRIIASKLQINAGANDLALLDATFDPASLQSLFLGADANARIIAAGSVTGVPNLQLGFVDGGTNARPELILVSGALGKDTAADRLTSLRLESSKDIVIGTQAFLEEFERAGGNLDLSILGEPDLARFNGTQDHVFIAADQLRLFAPGEIVQLNTGTSFVGAGVVFGEAPTGEGTIVNTGGGPERVNLFGTVIRSGGERVTSFEAGLEPNLLGPGLSQNGELRLNLCVIGNSSSCSIAILREAQESARSRNSALSSLTNATFFGFEDDEKEEEEEDLGGVAGSGNEGLWGIGLP